MLLEVSVVLFAPTSTTDAVVPPKESARLPLKLQRWFNTGTDWEAICTVPASMIVGPVLLHTPLNCIVPAPRLITLPAPEMALPI